MNNAWTVAKREFASFFQTPVGYVAVGMYALLSGLGFTFQLLMYAKISQSPTENGYGKRTPIGDYTKHGRGTQGMIAIQASERNGNLVAAQIVGDDDEIMLITTGGVLIRTRIAEIRDMGRATQGVRLINLGEGKKLAGLEKILEPDDEEEAPDAE